MNVAAPYEIGVRVTAADIDAQKHVNNTVYVRWMQDVAIAHWEAMASAEAQEKIGWVALRHEIDYKAPGFLDDELVLRTWVGKASRLTFERFTEVRRPRDGKVLAQGRTLWCPIDPVAGKPIRVPDEVRQQFSI